jgi:hypothetical protein
MTIKRRCGACGILLPLTEFYADQLRYTTAAKCKVCYNNKRKLKRLAVEPPTPVTPARMPENPWETLGADRRPNWGGPSYRETVLSPTFQSVTDKI